MHARPIRDVRERKRNLRSLTCFSFGPCVTDDGAALQTAQGFILNHRFVMTGKGTQLQTRQDQALNTKKFQ